MNDDAVADDSDFGLTVDFSVEHLASGDASHLADVEHFAYLDVAGDDFFNLRREHTFDSRLDFLDGSIDDGIDSNINLFAFG